MTTAAPDRATRTEADELKRTCQRKKKTCDHVKALTNKLMTSQLGDAYLLVRQKHPIINQSSANDYHSGRP